MATIKNRNSFRACNLSEETTENDLKRALMEHFSNEEWENIKIKIRTLAPSCLDGGSTQVAIFTFSPETPSFYLQKEKPCDIKVRGRNVAIDPNFFGLTQLYRTEGSITTDIVALTGMNGHAFGSWTNPSGEMWLKDYLSEDKDLKRCRTMTFGYDAKFVQTSTHSIEDYVRSLLHELDMARNSKEAENRPIILIGHSYGGIILKHALVTASQNPKSKSIYRAIAQMIFFGVPHRNLEFGDVWRMVEDKPGEQGRDLVTNMMYEARGGTTITENFKRIIYRRKISLISFYETLKTKEVEQNSNGQYERCGRRSMVVSRDSAVLGIHEEESHPIEADHSNLVKFQNASDPAYRSVLFYLKRAILAGIRDEVPKQMKSAGSAKTNGGDSKQEDELNIGGGDVVESSSPTDGDDNFLGQCLRLAVYTDNEKEARKLLFERADPNFQITSNSDESTWPNVFDSDDSSTSSSPGCDPERAREIIKLFESYDTPLAVAVKRRSPVMVQLLLDSGADPNLQCSRFQIGRTPLHEDACVVDDVTSIAELLLSKGANPNAKDDAWGTTPLHEAASCNNVRLISLLVRAKADLVARKTNGDTPLHVAASKGNPGAANMLLRIGADATATNNKGCTALHCAASAGYRDVAQLLLENCGRKLANYRDIMRNTALHNAAEGGYQEVVCLLVGSGADVTARNKFSRTAEDLAQKAGHHNVARLLRRGARR